jgi:nucleoid-associated protein Lsr2
MSKSVSVIITGDLDGSENAEVVSSGFDGVTCAIDLGKKNRSGLKRALAHFIEAGRRAPRSSCRPGLKVSGRGRISADIRRQYDAAC